MSYLDEATKAVTGDRRRDYGTPLINHLRIAVRWNTYLAKFLIRPITPPDVAMMMVDLKIARQQQTHKDDNFIDMLGYIFCIDSMNEDMVRLGFNNGNLAFKDFTFEALNELLRRLEMEDVANTQKAAGGSVDPSILYRVGDTSLAGLTEEETEKLNLITGFGDVYKKLLHDRKDYELSNTGEPVAIDVGKSRH